MVQKQDIKNITTSPAPDQSEHAHTAHCTIPLKTQEIDEETAVPEPTAQETCILLAQVWCPFCNTAKTINMDLLWRRNGTHRFRNIACISCKDNKRVGHWLCHHDSQVISVQTWLQNHSHDGKTFLKHECRPSTATVALFTGNTQDPSVSQHSTSSKRPMIALYNEQAKIDKKAKQARQI